METLLCSSDPLTKINADIGKNRQSLKAMKRLCEKKEKQHAHDHICNYRRAHSLRRGAGNGSNEISDEVRGLDTNI